MHSILALLFLVGNMPRSEPKNAKKLAAAQIVAAPQPMTAVVVLNAYPRIG